MKARAGARVGLVGAGNMGMGSDLLPYLPEGRFTLQVECAPDETEAVLEELRAAVPPVE